MATELSSIQKIATFLITLGPERSARVLEHLEPEQTARIAREIARMGAIPNQTRRAVEREFRALVHAEERQHAGQHFARMVLDKTLGSERAHTVMRQITPVEAPAGPPFLTTISPEFAAALLAKEPRQLIGFALVTLPRECAVDILSHFPPDLAMSLAAELPTVTPPPVQVRVALERAIRARARMEDEAQQSPPSGRQALAEIMAAMREQAEQPIPSPMPRVAFDTITRDTGEAEAYRVSFHEMGALDARMLQRVMRAAETQEIAHALRAADDSLRKRLLSAIPFRRRLDVQKRMKSKQPVRLQEIEAAQRHLADLAYQAMASETTPSPRQVIMNA